jgi:hypothetical protein
MRKIDQAKYDEKRQHILDAAEGASGEMASGAPALATYVRRRE